MADLKQLFKTAVASSMDTRGKPAILGKVDGTLYWSSSRRDMVWARIGEINSNQETVVQCTKVTPQIDMPVRVDLVNGILSVVAVDEKRYLEFSGNRPGGSVGAHAWLHGRLGPDPLYITGLQYLPLLVVPSNPLGLTVTVKQGAYRWEGEYKIFEEAVSGSLSAYVPGSSSVKHFVIICLDRANNSIVIVDGDDLTGGDDALFGGIVLTVADILAITISDAYFPLAAVVLYNGQTEVRAADIQMDLRTWGGEDYIGAVGIPEPIDDGQTYGRMTDTGVSSWVAVTPEAPTDGYMYARASGDWVSTGIFSGQITVGDGAQAQALTVNGDAGWTRDLRFSSGVSPRWIVRTTDAAEGGSDAGSNFEILARADSGEALSTPLAITRSTGLVTLSTGAVINGGVVFNETGADVDHRIEGDTATNLVVIDGGLNAFRVGTTVAGALLDVAPTGIISNNAEADIDFRIAGNGVTNGYYYDAGNNRHGFGTGTPLRTMHIVGGNGAVASFPGSLGAADFMLFENAGNMNMAFVSDTTSSAGIKFYRSGTAAFQGLVLYKHTTDEFDFYTGASVRMTLGLGLRVGSPTGGDKGAGTINAQAVYDDNTLLTDHIFDLYYDGRMSKADARTYPKARLWNVEETAVFTKENRHLPTMPGREIWMKSGPRSLGELVTALWETVEQQQLQIFELNDRLKAVANG